MSGRAAPKAKSGGIGLLVSDIDGTLVTPDKTLTPATIAAVRALDAAGIAFSVVSSRPPRGMAAIVEALQVRLPFGAFNGGSLVRPDLSLVSFRRLAADAARRALQLLAGREIDAWVFADDTWRLRRPDGPKVPRERRTVGFDPIAVDSFDDVIGRIDKIVGVSDDLARLAAVEAEAQILLAGAAVAQRSQPYYLDVTPLDADKGHAVREICAFAGVTAARTAVIGDMSNDLAMFRVAGFSIAMGEAPDEVKAQASATTAPNTDDGFAHAVTRLILPRADRSPP
jgi:Cof subfamily protein (haloacid dehalogenase superfamily)